MDPLRIGILGGSFNPIHCGHLAMGEAVCCALGLDRMIFVPTGNPPHKSKKLLAPKEHRVRMIEIATQGNARFDVSRIEVDSEKTGYTVETLKALRETCKAQDQFYFTLGADSVVDLANWRSFSELARLCSFAAVARPGIDRIALERCILQLHREYQAHIQLIEMELCPISSSKIRQNIQFGKPITGLVPPCVEDYINEYKVYGG